MAPAIPEDVNDATLHYLDVIFRLTQRAEAANTTEIAARIGVTPSGASVMLKRLADRGLIALTPYRGATLTTKGRRIALRTIRRHRLLEAFLYSVMGFTWDEVDLHAHALETAINEAFEDRMDALMGHPTRCPHGHLIPSKDGVMPQVADVPLVEQKAGARGVVRLVDTDNSDWLRYIGELGLMPGAQVVIKEIAPYGGPITLIKDAQAISLGRNLAELMAIELI
ncbi:MAG: metal-dependent transcriptional regulator [Thermoflexales bacterium]|nr:metal-dependent transcriptional regulator [Thermoflexales bacterium]